MTYKQGGEQIDEVGWFKDGTLVSWSDEKLAEASPNKYWKDEGSRFPFIPIATSSENSEESEESERSEEEKEKNGIKERNLSETICESTNDQVNTNPNKNQPPVQDSSPQLVANKSNDCSMKILGNLLSTMSTNVAPAGCIVFRHEATNFNHPTHASNTEIHSDMRRYLNTGWTYVS